jgi:AraC-like DNA-binding protein
VQRVAFWRDGVLRRMELMQMPQTAQPFRARLRRIVADGAELIEHASNAVFAVRTPRRRRVDGCDDIGIDVMRRSLGAAMEHNGEHRIRSGDLYLTDYAQPSQVRRSEHCTAGIMLSRHAVRDAVGDVSAMAGIKFGAIGLAAVLRRHLGTTFDEAAVMSSAERLVALKAAVDMTLALMRIHSNRAADVEQFDSGFYRAAHVIIERDCSDPELRPEGVALILGCSRASLYRAFARRDESVAAVIWQARTARAWGLLTSAEGVGLLVLDIALLSGFRDMPTFTRMFKRRYGMTPSEARASLS